MLSENKVKIALRKGEDVYGLFCSIPAPQLIEMIGFAGYDFVIIDTEHASVDPQQLENMIRSAETSGVTPFVRVPDPSPGPILRALDAGAMGIVVPHVCHAEDIVRAVRACRYAPDGFRSLNSGRQTGYGRMNLIDYLATANAEIMVVGMIEDREGVEAIDSIAAVPGLDLILEGAADLSQSYGVPWQTRHPLVRSALVHVAERCAKFNVKYCAIIREPQDQDGWINLGVNCFVLGEERGTAVRALRKHLESFRNA